MKNFLMPSIWINVYEDDAAAAAATAAATATAAAAAAAAAAATGGNPPAGTATGAPPSAGAPPKAGAPTGPDTVKAFSQADVDRIVQSRLKKANEAQKNLVGEVNALKAKADLTTEERSDWETRVSQLSDSLLSTTELATKEASARLEEHNTVLSTKDDEIAKWQNLYTTSQITRSLSDASIEHKAFHPEQIISLLDRQTRLVEDLADGKPTGRLVPRVRFEDVDDKGKPVTLDISPSEAVKRMTEIGKYQNLFEGKGTGGVGTRSHAEGSKKQNLANLAKSPGDYIKARRDGTVTLD